MIGITFAYSAVLGGLAGILVAPLLFVSINMGSTIALKAFAASIIGGFGDVTGAIVGGIAGHAVHHGIAGAAAGCAAGSGASHYYRTHKSRAALQRSQQQMTPSVAQ